MTELFKKLLKTDTHLPNVMYTSYEVYVKYIHLSSTNRKPGIRGQQVQREINIEIHLWSQNYTRKTVVYIILEFESFY